MKNSSDFAVSEMEKLITIANNLGVNIPENVSPSIDLYLNEIIKQLKNIPYCPYPISFHTIDIAIISYDSQTGKERLLLGRKPGKTNFQFIGGFIEPGESAEDAVIREMKEETNLSTTSNLLFYLRSFFIDDERYKNSCHKITTSFFRTLILNDAIDDLKAQDDIQEVKWFEMDELRKNYKDIIIPMHYILFEELKGLPL